MLSMYPACFFHEDNSYSVVFPGLNWLSTCGDTFEWRPYSKTIQIN